MEVTLAKSLEILLNFLRDEQMRMPCPVLVAVHFEKLSVTQETKQ